MTDTELAQQRITECEQELSAIARERDELMAREQRLQRKLASWRGIMEADMPLHTEHPSLPPAVPVWQEPPRKIEIVREILHGEGATGLTPKDITRIAVKRGIDLGNGFASNAVFRLKKSGDAIERNGRYILKEFAEEETSI